MIKIKVSHEGLTLPFQFGRGTLVGDAAATACRALDWTDTVGTPTLTREDEPLDPERSLADAGVEAGAELGLAQLVDAEETPESEGT